jgi:hypothetical protein
LHPFEGWEEFDFLAPKFSSIDENFQVVILGRSLDPGAMYRAGAIEYRSTGPK